MLVYSIFILPLYQTANLVSGSSCTVVNAGANIPPYFELRSHDKRLTRQSLPIAIAPADPPRGITLTLTFNILNSSNCF